MPWPYKKPCPFCGEIMVRKDPATHPTHDHLLPRSRGGTDRKFNIIVICRTCNKIKDNMTLFEFMQFLRQINDWGRLQRIELFIEERKRLKLPWKPPGQTMADVVYEAR